MNPGRISRPMIVAILVMFGAWLALGFVANGGQSSLAAPAYLFINIARMLLMAGIIICLIATGIAWCKGAKAAAGEKLRAGAGALVALIISMLTALVAGAGVWDAAYGRGGSGEWSGLGELFVYAICLPGGIAALVMALSLKSMPRPLRLTCIVLALLALGLPFAVHPLRKARDKRRYEEMRNSGITRKLIEAAKENAAGER